MELSSRGLPIKTTLNLNHIGKAMAKGMKESVDGLALSQVTREVDLSSFLLYAKHFDTPFNTLIMAVVARTLPRHPLLNAELVGDRILVYEPFNLGMAVETENGLVVIVLPDADKLPLHDLDEMIQDRANRARHGKISLSDIEGGTFTISNLGMYGIDGGFSIPRPPESAILLIGAVRSRPVVVDGQLVARDICWVSLTFDHRFIDGATAALFLKDINETCNHIERMGNGIG